MKSNDLIDIIGEAADAHIKDAKTHKRKMIPRWAKWSSAAAACLCLIFGAGYMMNHLGGSAGGGGDSDLTYMYYAGPVLPLTIQGENADITATRNTDYNFSPYISVEHSYEDNAGVHTYQYSESKSIITDTYTLVNESDSQRTFSLLYPVIGDMQSLENYPTITVNGTPVETIMHPGPYSGGFEGVWGANDQETGSSNIKALDSFDGYAALLSDDRYLTFAFDDFPTLNQPVTVYRLHDFVYSSVTGDINPSLSMEFYVDHDKTTVFSYGMNGCSFDWESGWCARQKGAIEYRPNAAAEFQYPDDGYVILLGDDIDGYTIQGYQNMGCKKGEELDDLSCTVTRYESTLGEILRTLFADFLGENERQQEALQSSEENNTPKPSLDLYCGLAAELLESYGIIGDTPVQRYDSGMLEDIFSAVCIDGRILYFSFDATIPAGGNIIVEATTHKDASMDFIGKDTGKDGYDMATQLGSNIRFTEQNASISGYDAIEIVSQNFGFDLQNRITEVTLDLSEPHYWLEVRKTALD